jgi:predicted metal-dependent hydrolase
MSLIVRCPEIDYEKCFPKWAPNLEFAMQMNAFSITPVHLEPYIVKVYLEVKKQLDPVKDADLIEEVEWFIAQETQHYRQHMRFNRVFQTPRYPEVEKLGKKFAEDLDDFRKNKSLMFNLSYVEGFESAGGVFFRVWFEKLGKYRFGARPEALLLYDWHFAEEFEHREVAYKLYMHFAKRGNFFRRIWYGYFYRIYGALKMLSHSGAYLDQIRKHLLDVERSEMTSEQAARSVAKEKALGKFMFMTTVRGLTSILSPFYDPYKKPPPEGLEAILADFDKGGRYSKSSVST